jgi:hypothetical protein
MSRRTFTTSGSVMILSTSLAAGCSIFDSPTTEGAGATNGTGASNGYAGSSMYQPPTCDQGCQDYLVAYALNDTLWFAWNQKLAGKPVGMQDTTASCALGGSVHITGFDEVLASGATSTDMLFSFADCANANQTYDLTFSGEVSMEGSLDPNVDFAALTFSVPQLEVRGALDWLDDPEIDQSCPVNFSQQGTGDSFALAGRVCGRTFDEDSLARAGSSNGNGGSSNASGGSSSTSGSGNACTCFCPDGSDCTGAPGPNPCGVDADGIPEACGCPVGCP